MNDRARVLAAVGVTVLLFLCVQLGALTLVEPFQESERQAVENPEDPANSLVYFAAILVATAFMLAAFKYNAQWLIRGLVIAVSAMLGWFVFAEIVPPIIVVGSLNLLALLGGLGVGLALLVYPEWYVIDTAGVLMGAGAAGLFGISFGLLPAIILLIALAIYDAISVYKTKHMLSLAEGVMDLKIPVVLVVPTRLSYSYLADGSTDGVIEGEATDDGNDGSTSDTATQAASEHTDDSTELETEHTEDSVEDRPRDRDDTAAEADVHPERDALFIGLGDAVIPTILVASAAYFLEAPTLGIPGIAMNVPALGAIVGTIAGLLVLMYMVLQGKPHAGLPLLNGGAISGYLIGAVASGISIATALGLSGL
ncbi:presenilin family intramembrane aspartyl protease [Halobacteria archaeon AArc-m2/3/4]|uniref:Presenilin family intramembrane aspartyl protease n=1 Tax=Natronoglomus mannanivorans TaxID=2979990 RepID=A0AAP2YWV7_9EURY|nr:presenilin family intramembrane aspartyl protease [Halobacteria archaeon AArc-xg1-1]MCU4971388.1 presenilin family intramembrane aspartyl protease [Halobacteria archaeon AArc-m2/3/4]